MDKIKQILANLIGAPLEVIADLGGRLMPCCDPSQKVQLEEAFNRYGLPLVESGTKSDDCICTLSIALLNGQGTAEQQRRAALALLSLKLTKFEDEILQHLTEDIMAKAGAYNPNSKVTIH